jgi:hypothetical protein
MTQPDTSFVARFISWLFDLANPPVWIRPMLGSVDDGFVSWLVSASGSKILDVRWMSESKRFWQYGEFWSTQ